jgi:hypothetical protein
MAYLGEQYDGYRNSELPDIYGNDPRVFVVSGSTSWGHALLYTASGWFHITEPFSTYPYHILGMDSFKQYIEENDKFVLGEIQITDVLDKDRLAGAIRRSLNRKWFWGGFFHNCLTYAETMLQAGRSKFKFKNTNFPTNGLTQVQTLQYQRTVGDAQIRTEKEAKKSEKRFF